MPSNQRSSPQVVRTSPSYAASDACVLNYEASSGGDSEDSPPPSHRVVLRLSALLGNLAHLFLLHLPLDSTMSAVVDPTEISLCMARVFLGIEATAVLLSLDLEQAIRNKMILNARKYPVELVKGKQGKYTQYSDQTGITKHEGQSTVHLPTPNASPHAGENIRSRLCILTSEIREFSVDRDWPQFHLPRNLALALAGEVGELSEEIIAQPVNRDKLAQELADVSIYFLRLADVCGVDITEELLRQAAGESDNDFAVPQRTDLPPLVFARPILPAFIGDSATTCAPMSASLSTDDVIPLHQTRDLLLWMCVLHGRLTALESSSHAFVGTLDLFCQAIQDTAETLRFDLVQALVCNSGIQPTEKQQNVSLLDVLPDLLEAQGDYMNGCAESLCERLLQVSTALGEVCEIPQFQRDKTQSFPDVEKLRQSLVKLTAKLLPVYADIVE